MHKSYTTVTDPNTQENLMKFGLEAERITIGLILIVIGCLFSSSVKQRQDSQGVS
jgi:hypothetical protein